MPVQLGAKQATVRTGPGSPRWPTRRRRAGHAEPRATQMVRRSPAVAPGPPCGRGRVRARNMPKAPRFGLIHLALPLLDPAVECYPDDLRNFGLERGPRLSCTGQSGRRSQANGRAYGGATRCIRCKGSWLEIGRQYGEELRTDVAHASRAIEELAIAAGHDRMSLKARINDYIPFFLRSKTSSQG